MRVGRSNNARTSSCERSYQQRNQRPLPDAHPAAHPPSSGATHAAAEKVAVDVGADGRAGCAWDADVALAVLHEGAAWLFRATSCSSVLILFFRDTRGESTFPSGPSPKHRGAPHTVSVPRCSVATRCSGALSGTRALSHGMARSCRRRPRYVAGRKKAGTRVFIYEPHVATH